MAVLPFYGATEPELFAIERAAMDRVGRVIDRLDQLLPPAGIVLDIGAGDGFTARRLTTARRTVLSMEPAVGMVRRRPGELWARGDAEALPFAGDAVDAAYATWAYFFSRGFDPSTGLREVRRVVRPGGALVFVDNAGADEFGELAGADLSADPDFWEAAGFGAEVVDTAFEFASGDDADRLLTRYFGPDPAHRSRTTIGYRVSVFTGTA